MPVVPHLRLALLAALACVSCSGFDADLLKSRDAGTKAADGIAMDGGADGGPVDDPGGPMTPVASSDPCNGTDDDGDGRIDEASDACGAPNATASCIAAVCFIVECDEGYRDCDGDAESGCEVDIRSPESCGRCGNDCSGLNNVEGANCDVDNGCTISACADGFVDCDGDTDNGCEASFAEVLNCGGCAERGDNEPCTDLSGVLTSTCEDRSCSITECLPGFGDCNGEASDGCERDVAASGCCPGEPDSDGDGTLDCLDGCVNDSDKTSAGECGCGVSDVDADGDGVADCRNDCWGLPSNFDPIDEVLSFAVRGDLTCSPTIDTTLAAAEMIRDWCNGTPPTPVVRAQPEGGPDVVIVPLAALTLAAGETLRLIGDRPIILAVQGSVRIDGTIDAGSDMRVTAGAGATESCSGGGDGRDGVDVNNDGGSGGGGGSFGSVGGNGGLSEDGLGGRAGAASPDPSLVPLRAGCGGGDGGDDGGTGGIGGYGGGALQISTPGRLVVSSTGAITASGGGGAPGSVRREGGGGGGSGGAILLEANEVELAVGSWVTAHGGSGAAGHYELGLCSGAGGANGDGTSNTPTAGGWPCLGSGWGGSGAAAGGPATNGGFSNNDDGAGGGGGGLGVVVQQPLEGSLCTVE